MNNKSNEKPQFKHDCSNCTFLGRHRDDYEYDLYHCMQGGSLPTVIARYGDYGPDYLSGIEFGHAEVLIGEFNKPLAQAYMRAKALDLKVTM
jgi:hypothetical protein